jgi:hypothetical protein
MYVDWINGVVICNLLKLGKTFSKDHKFVIICVNFKIGEKILMYIFVLGLGGFQHWPNNN